MINLISSAVSGAWADALAFGAIDNGVLLVGALFGLEVERLLPGRLQRGMGAVVGAGIGNAFSDFLGGLAVSPTFAAGTGLGCLAALALLPVLARIAKAVQA